MENLGQFVLTLIVGSLLASRSEAFSYNVRARTVFSPGEGTNNHSYFGYSVLLRAGSTPTIVVGAPQDTSTYEKHSSIKDPGVIHICSFDADKQNIVCRQAVTNVEGNIKHSTVNGKEYQNHKDNMWLGMSIAGETRENGATVMCAPRWINEVKTDIDKDEYSFYGNGVCYAYKNSVENKGQKDSPLMPISEIKNQGFGNNRDDYLYAYGQAGFSSKLSNDGKVLILGAPGISNWLGSVVKYDVSKRFVASPIPDPVSAFTLSNASYLGYSVDSGTFISGQSDLFAAGAPRAAECNGQVIIFDFKDGGKTVNVLNGSQMGEYFGATIEAVDINGDGLTDLLVGAPLFFTKDATVDQGRVYVFINKGEAQFENVVMLYGDKNNKARFGSSIATIGDINEDGFADIAIGAPYENNGKGAVFIYLGTKTGINPIYSQKIALDDMKGFGISISKGVDIDNNTCSDIAIGAHETAKVVLLRCHPSVEIVPRMQSFPPEVPTDATNFTVEICFEFIGSIFPTDLTVELTLDPIYKRVMLQNDRDAVIKISRNYESDNCKKININIKDGTTDFSHPIHITLNYKLDKDPLEDAKFCPKCPVLRPINKSDALLRVSFASGCGEDLVCSPNLVLNVSKSVDLPYVTGSTHSIGLNIYVENLGEPAFLPRVEVMFPQRTPIVRLPPFCNLVTSILSCDFPSPLRPSSNKTLILEFDTSLLTNLDTDLMYNVTVISSGEEINSLDNNVIIEIPLKTDAKINVIGKVATDEIQYINSQTQNKTNIIMSHGYEIINKGPTELDSVMIRFYIPVAYNGRSNSNITLLSVFEPKITNQTILSNQPLCYAKKGHFTKERRRVNYDMDSTKTRAKRNSDDHLYKLLLRNIDSTSQVNIRPSSGFESSSTVSELPTNSTDAKFSDTDPVYINCTNFDQVTCMVIECHGSGHGLTGSGIHFSMRMLLNVENTEKIINERPLVFSTYAVVEPTKTNLQWHSYGSASTIVIEGIPPRSVSIWLYILALLIGIALLALVIYGLYRFGFFKRKTHEDFEKMKSHEKDKLTETAEAEPTE